MFRVNQLLITRILFRTSTSIAIVFLTLFFTGQVGDSAGYIGLIKFNFTGGSAELVRIVFSIISIFKGIVIPFLISIVLANSYLFLIINKYINQRNSLYWYLLLYLPGPLIYACVPSKEYLFFSAAVSYLIIEIEDLFTGNKKQSKSLIKFLLKIALLILMFAIKAISSAPYILFASIVFLYKNINFKTIKIKNINFPILIFYSFFISQLFIVIINLINPQFLFNITDYLNQNFSEGGSFTRQIDFEKIRNIYNPLIFLNIQLSALFPTIKQIFLKPYVLVILFESLVFLYLYCRSWTNLFSAIRNDNVSKNIFVIVFIFVACTYFLIYGLTGYKNIGSSQRFRVRVIPIAIILPLVAEQVIYKKKLNVNIPRK